MGVIYDAPDVDQLRDMLTGRLIAGSRMLNRFSLRTPPPWLAVLPGDEGSVTHFGGYDSAGAGWGARVFDRRHVEIEAVRWNGSRPGEPIVVLRDLRGALQRTVFESGVIRKYEGLLETGNARSLAGGRGWFRASRARMEDPATGQIVRVDPHVPKYGALGLLVERFRVNLFSNSLCSSLGVGVGEWEGVGSGSNGSLVQSSSAIMFANNNNSIRILTGSPNITDTYVNQASLAGSTTVGDWWLSFDHMEINGVAPSYAVRDNPGNWWSALTQSWGAFTWNFVPLADNRVARYETRIPFINAGAPNFRFGYRSTDGNASEAVLFTAQLENGRSSEAGRWASSRIATPLVGAWSLSTAARCSDLYVWANDLDARAWNSPHGTLLVKITPLWSSANAEGLTFELIRVYYTDADYISIFYTGSAATWTARRRCNGVNIDLTSDARPMTAGTTHTLAFRWAGSDGELVDTYGANSTGYTWCDMIIDGTLVAGVESKTPVESDESRIYVGGTEGQQIDSWIQPEIVPYVLSKRECARWLL